MTFNVYDFTQYAFKYYDDYKLALEQTSNAYFYLIMMFNNFIYISRVQYEICIDLLCIQTLSSSSRFVSHFLSNASLHVTMMIYNDTSTYSIYIFFEIQPLEHLYFYSKQAPMKWKQIPMHNTKFPSLLRNIVDAFLMVCYFRPDTICSILGCLDFLVSSLTLQPQGMYLK